MASFEISLYLACFFVCLLGLLSFLGLGNSSLTSSGTDSFRLVTLGTDFLKAHTDNGTFVLDSAASAFFGRGFTGTLLVQTAVSLRPADVAGIDAL